jgi:hypothetical protein
MSGFVVQADASNLGLTAPELVFIRDNITEFTLEQLKPLSLRLELAAIIDPTLAMATREFPQKLPLFRNEVMYMAYVLKYRLEEIDKSAHCEEGFSNWVVSVSGVAIEDRDTCDKIIRNIGSAGSNEDAHAFKLATGRLIAMAAYRRIKDHYQISKDSVVDDVATSRLAKIIRVAANGCIFSKIGKYQPGLFVTGVVV